MPAAPTIAQTLNLSAPLTGTRVTALRSTYCFFSASVRRRRRRRTDDGRTTDERTDDGPTTDEKNSDEKIPTKKFRRKNSDEKIPTKTFRRTSTPKSSFLKCYSGGVWGSEAPLRNLRYPCLASAAAVPCPRALPPICFSSEFFRPNYFVRIFVV